MPDHDLGVLSRSRATQYVVGSNLRTELSGAGWLYALPRLRYASVMSLGTPSLATLTALTRVSDDVVIIDPEEGWLSCRDVGVGRMAAPERIIEVLTTIVQKLPSRTEDS